MGWTSVLSLDLLSFVLSNVFLMDLPFMHFTNLLVDGLNFSTERCVAVEDTVEET